MSFTAWMWEGNGVGTGRKICGQWCHVCGEEYIGNMSTKYQSLSGHCLLCDVFKWLRKLSAISHSFQDTVYWAMLSSDCNLSTNYQSQFSGHCFLSDAIKWLQFVNKLSVTVFRTLFTEWCHQVTAICQQTISHFQDTVYCAMPSSDCNLSTNYQSLSGHSSLSDAINCLSLLFTIQNFPASSVGPRQAVLPKICRNLLQHLLWKFVLVLLT